MKTSLAIVAAALQAVMSAEPRTVKRLTGPVGRYRFSVDIVVTIARRGDHLVVQENAEPAQEICPESERDFFSNVADDTFTFVETTRID